MKGLPQLTLQKNLDNHPGGKVSDYCHSIVNSLTEMKEIERVKITINGKTTKNFKDNVTLQRISKKRCHCK